MSYPSCECIDVKAEIEKFFQDPNLTPSDNPQAVVLCGGMCAGKTTLRKSKFAAGFVVLDAAEIFLNLTGSSEPRFPGPLAKTVWKIGRGVFLKAVNRRLNLVTDIIGSEDGTFQAITEVLCCYGYRIEYIFVDAGFEECVRRKMDRADDNLSSYFTEGFHVSWICGMEAPDYIRGMEEPGWSEGLEGGIFDVP